MAGIRIELQLEDGSFTSGMLRAGQSLSGFRKELSRLDPHFRKLEERGQGTFRSFKKVDDQSRSLLGRLRDITIVGHGVAAVFGAMVGSSNGLVGSIVRINSEMERLRFQLAGMSTAADPLADAADQVRNLQEVAKTAPFAFTQITNTMVKMKVAGLDPMNGSMKALLDGVAAFGGSDEQLHRITLGITQMAGKGVIQMEELRQQLGESMPAAMKLMARSMGVSIGELTRMIATGRVEAGAALSKWFDQVDLSYGGSSNRMMGTFAGQMSRMKTAFTQQVTREGGGTRNAFESLKTTMGEIVQILESPQATQFFDMVGNGLQKALDAGRAFAGMLVTVKDTVENLGKVLPIMLGGAVLGMAMGRTMAAFNAMRVSLLSISSAAIASKNSITSMTRAAVLSRHAQAAADMSAAYASVKKKDKNGLVTKDPVWIEARDRRDREAALASGGALKRAGVGLAGSIGPALAGLSRFLGLLGPIALGISVILPLAYEVGKGIFNWVTGAKEAEKQIENTRKAARDFADEQRRNELDTQDDTWRGAISDLGAQQADELDRARRERVRLIALMRIDERYERKEDPEKVQALAAVNAELLAMEDRHAQDMTDLMRSHGMEREEILRRQAAERLRERKQETQAIVDETMAQVDQDIEPQRRAYNENGENLLEEYNKRLKIEQDANRSGVAAREWYNEQIKKDDTELLKAESDSLLKRIEAREALTDQSEAELEATRLLREEYMQLQTRIQEVNSTQRTIELLNAPESDEKKMERLIRFVESAQDKVKELSAEINGASGPLAKLIYQIQRGDFGNLEDGTEEAAQLREELISATVAAELLQGVMDQFKEADTELDGILKRREEELWKARAINAGIDPDNELEYFKFRNADLLEDSTTTQSIIQQQFDKITNGVTEVIPHFQSLATQMQEKTFGSQTLEAINTVTAAITALGVAAGSMQLPELDPLGVFGMKGGDQPIKLNATANAIRTGLIQRGLAPHVVEGLLWNGQDESGLNPGIEEGKPNKHGTKGYGLMQWTGSRRDGLEAFAREQGKPINDLSMQLDFIMKELETSHQEALRLAEAAGSAPGAAIAFLKKYLIPAKEHQNTRATKYAQGKVSVPGGAYDITEATDAARGNLRTRVEGAEADPFSDSAQQEIYQSVIKTAVDEMKSALEASKAGDDTVGSRNEQQARIDILTGKYGNKDVNADQYKGLLETARQLDAFTKNTKEVREAESDITRNLEQIDKQRLEIAERRATAEQQFKDPNYKGLSSDLVKLNQLEKEHLALVERVSGKNSDAYRAAKDDFAQQRAAIMGAEGAEALVTLREYADEAEKEAMTDRERRRADHQEKLAQFRAERDAAIKGGMDVALANQTYERARLAAMKAYQQENRSAMAQQIQDTSKLGDNFKNAAGGWTSALSEALYNEDFSSLGEKIREDIARAMTDKASSLIMEPLMSALEGPDGEGGLFGFAQSLVSSLQEAVAKANPGGAAGGAGGGLLTSLFKGIGSFFGFGTAHSGAVVGRGFPSITAAPASVFAGAQKYHTGGIVDSTPQRFPMHLAHDEVPVITKKKEGIFTPEQMKHLGGTSVRNNAVTLAPTINVNASGGTAEQNADLAKQISQETERSMRGLIRDELVKQSRPGAMFGRK